MAVSVYWIHHPEHTDMFTQGYIGITKDITNRFESHKNRPANKHFKRAIKKYGWDNLVKEILLVSDRVYCYLIESQLRPKEYIGWNINKGGGFLPEIPWNKGIKLNEEQLKKQFKIGELTKGKPAHNKGKPMLPHVKEALLKHNIGKKISQETKAKMSLAHKGKILEKVECPYCKTIGGICSMKRWHFNNCRLKGMNNV
jgi:hypothetical protein